MIVSCEFAALCVSETGNCPCQLDMLAHGSRICTIVEYLEALVQNKAVLFISLQFICEKNKPFILSYSEHIFDNSKISSRIFTSKD